MPCVTHLWYSATFSVPQRRIWWDWCVTCGERNPMPTSGSWNFSHHAIDRALDMALDSDMIRSLLTAPQVKQPGGLKYPDGYEIWAHDRIAAVIHPDTDTVVTFLWRGVVYERGTESEPYRDN